MKIGSPTSSNFYFPAQKAARTENAAASFSNELSNSDSSSETSTTYDFTNITQQQLQAAISDLYQSGKMSFDEISLAAPMIQSPLAKVEIDGSWPDSYSQPTNFMSTLSLGLDGAKSRGDADEVTNLTKLMGALERNQGSTTR